MAFEILEQSAPEDFLKSFTAGKPAMLWYRVLNDVQTPLATYVKLRGQQRYGYILESVLNGENRGRYCIMGTDPDLLWQATGNQAHINTDPDDPSALETLADSPRTTLQVLLEESRVATPTQLPLLSSLLVGYLGYDCVRWQENIPDTNPDTLDTPDGLMMRPRLVLVFDIVTDMMSVIALHYPATRLTKIQCKTVEAQAALLAARNRLDCAMQSITGSLPSFAATTTDGKVRDFHVPQAMDANMSPEQFKQMVLRAKEYIAAGDIFQAVLSQRFSMDFPLPGLSLFRMLRRSNPSPFLFLLECNDFSVTGSSPELMVRLRDNKITIRPIAGTRPRGATQQADQVLAQELLADPKENAEHLMLLDLGRNDVGRVSKVGSVRVTSQFQVERYSHVMHLVSNVEGERDDGHSRIDTLMAGFPAGTVSGAPKIRAMEIIDELESERRGVYAGCVGYFDGDSGMDNCIALRTAVIKDGRLTVQAGAGIVADSDPDTEHQECVNKARAIFSAACKALQWERTRHQQDKN